MSKVLLFDHVSQDKVGNIDKNYLMGIAKEDNIGCTDRMDKASHVIGHFENLDYLFNPNVTTCLDGQIVLCVTKRRPGIPVNEHEHVIVITKERKRYILFARYVSALEQKEVAKEFFLMDELQAEAIVKDKPGGVPAELRRLFYADSLECFLAFAILCQGYLAVVGAAELYPNEVSEVIRNDVAGGDEYLKEAERHTDEVRNVTEWFRPGVEGIRQALGSCGGEEKDYWESLSRGSVESKESLQAIQKLYKALEEAEASREAAETLDWNKLVEEAYQGFMALVERGCL